MPNDNDFKVKKVSLKVIADALGVSTATVSLVLNGKNQHGRVSEEMSRKILQKASELNYVPNSLAKGLKMGHSHSIGLIVGDISNVFFGTLALHIQNYAEKKDYTVVIGNTNEQLEQMKKMVSFLNSRQVDGLIITPTEGGEKITYALLEEHKPLVLVDRSFPKLDVFSVLINNYEICYRATRWLLDKGCKNPAFISYKQDQFHTNERKRGFVEAVRDAGCYDRENIWEVSYQSLNEDIEKAIERLCIDRKADAIFFATNSISIAGVRELFKHGFIIQKDIEVMCFDESEAIQLLPFSIPYIKQPIEEMAKKALDLLIEQIETKETKSKALFLDAEFVV